MKRSLGFGLFVCACLVGAKVWTGAQRQPDSLVLPAATLLSVKVTKTQGDTVDVRVVPTRFDNDDVWGRVAAQYKDCSTTGKNSRDPAISRSFLEFDGELECPTFRPVKIRGYAVEPTEGKNGVPGMPAVGSVFAMVITDSAVVLPKPYLAGLLSQISQKLFI